MMKFKDAGVDGNVKGVEFLLKKNKIDAVHGTGRILAPGKIEVNGNSGAQVLDTRNIVIATGSDVARLKGIEIDEKRIVSSDAAIALGQVPERLLVVGAGVIGLELGSVWRRLGREGDGGRIPRPHPAGHRPGSRQAVPAHSAEAGHDVQTVLESHGGRRQRKDLEGHASSPPLAARRKRSRPMWCSWRSGACPTRTGWG